MLSSNYFVGIYARGPSWLPGKTIREQPLEAHFAYMAALQDSSRRSFWVVRSKTMKVRTSRY